MCYLNRKLDTEILRLRKGTETMLINNVMQQRELIDFKG